MNIPEGSLRLPSGKFFPEGRELSSLPSGMNIPGRENKIPTGILFSLPGKFLIQGILQHIL